MYVLITNFYLFLYTIYKISLVLIVTYSNICPSDDKLSLSSHQEGIETEMVDTQVHPSLSRYSPLPIATGVIYQI